MTEESKIKAQFFNSLVRGTGEAYLLMQRHPHFDFSALILKGAIRNYAYDQQCEGSRAYYIYQLVKKSKQRERLAELILTKLKNKKGDEYGLAQLSDLATYLHKAGHPKAKTALYARIEKNNLKDYEVACKDQLIEVDGLSGLLKVAEVVGKWILAGDGRYEDSWRADEFQRENKSINVYTELEKAGKGNEYIRAYFQSIISNQWVPFKRKKKRIKFTYEDAKKVIEDKRFRYISKPRADDLTDMEVKQLADEFLLENDMAKKVNYLRFFRNRKFPYSIEPILKIARGRVLHKSRAVEHACESLQYFTDERIRSLAFDKINTAKYPNIYLSLLVSNYKDGDDVLLKELAEKASNYDAIHHIVFGLVEIYQNNPSPFCKAPLEVVYDKMNCGIHRASILEILHQNGVLSEKIFVEMQYDSYDEVRALYRKIRKHKLDNAPSPQALQT